VPPTCCGPPAPTGRADALPASSPTAIALSPRAFPGARPTRGGTDADRSRPRAARAGAARSPFVYGSRRPSRAGVSRAWCETDDATGAVPADAGSPSAGLGFAERTCGPLRPSEAPALIRSAPEGPGVTAVGADAGSEGRTPEATTEAGTETGAGVVTAVPASGARVGTGDAAVAGCSAAGVAGGDAASVAGGGAVSVAGGAVAGVVGGAGPGTALLDAGGAGAGGVRTGRCGRNRSGSRYPCSSAATRIPRWTYGSSTSVSPLEPTVATRAPSATTSPLRDDRSPRCVSVTACPPPVAIVTVFPWRGTVPANVTTPAAGARTSSPCSAPMSIPRCCPPAYGSSPNTNGLSTSPPTGHDQALAVAGAASPKTTMTRTTIGLRIVRTTPQLLEIVARKDNIGRDDSQPPGSCQL
jgi:hypothetical protein